MPLNDTQIKNAKPRERPYKIADASGLTLLINPNGSKWWRLRYRINGTEKMLSLGVYPDVSLAKARSRRDEHRSLIVDGVDPSEKRQAVKLANNDTFAGIGREWLSKREHKLAAITVTKTKWMLETFIYPDLGSKPINKITAPELLAALRKIEARGRHETAHRTKQKVGEVLRYAVATGRAERDITSDLRGALSPVTSKHHAAITEPGKIGELLRAIDGYTGNPTTAYALKLAPLLFVRPGELRLAEWQEFDFDASEWRIPGPRMKMRQQHLVPLSAQAVELLRELQAINGDGRFLFPSLRTRVRAMSENTVNAALRRLGYSNTEMTGHGFRSLASTSLNEQGWHPDLIELQLAHKERDKIRGAYNHAQRLGERKKMMQAWANYLDTLKAGRNVVPIRTGARQ
jgi:integrase